MRCGLPFIAITVTDSVEAKVEKTIFPGKGQNGVLAEVVVSAAAVSTRVHA